MKKFADWLYETWPIIAAVLIVMVVLGFVAWCIVTTPAPPQPAPPPQYEATPPATFCRIMDDSAGGYDMYCWIVPKD